MAVGHHKRPSTAGRPILDWTRENSRQELADFQRFTKENVDWSESPLGPMAKWPTSLRQMVLLVMADPTPSAVLYTLAGRTAIVYNEAFAGLIGQRHPALQGQLVQGQLDELCSGFDDVWERQTQRGVSETIANQRIRQHRLGFVEEKFYRWKLVPLICEDGYVDGSVVTVDEQFNETSQERRESTARDFGNGYPNAMDLTAEQAALTLVGSEGRYAYGKCDCEKLWYKASQLQHFEARYEKFADLAPVGIAMLDKDNQIEYANKAYHEIMSDDALSKSILDSVHQDDSARVQSYFEMLPFRDAPFTFECRLRKTAAQPAVSPSEAPPGPTPTCVLASMYMQQEPEPHTVCWIIDVTTHRNAEEFLRRRMDEAIEMRRQKEHFIDMISHEVRNPLSAMLHCTDEIIEDVQHPDAHTPGNVLEAAHTIEYCSQHIRNIVGDVLTLSKLDSRLVEICPTAIRPCEVIENALKMFYGELRANSIEMAFETDKSMKDLQIDWLSVDPTRMLQVLINLVTNAIKVVKGRTERRISVRASAARYKPFQTADGFRYVPPRLAPRQIDFGIALYEAERIYLVVAVEDTGPGLSPDEMSSLFERFAQENPKTESKYGGSGLGLFISRDLTELQGGQLGIATSPGTGSKFVFSVESRRANGQDPNAKPFKFDLPLRTRSTRVLDSPVTSSPTRSQLPNGPRALKQTSARKVLVVEDNLINQRVLASQLRKHGCEVSVALHGQEALEVLCMTSAPKTASTDGENSSNIIFDVVLMDIEMPIMDGLTCAQAIRAFESARACPARLPMIALTANARKEQTQAALDAGMDAVTTKPYRIAELMKQIEHTCRMAAV